MQSKFKNTETELLVRLHTWDASNALHTDRESSSLPARLRKPRGDNLENYKITARIKVLNLEWYNDYDHVSSVLES